MSLIYSALAEIDQRARGARADTTTTANAATTRVGRRWPLALLAVTLVLLITAGLYTWLRPAAPPDATHAATPSVAHADPAAPPRSTEPADAPQPLGTPVASAHVDPESPLKPTAPYLVLDSAKAPAEMATPRVRIVRNMAESAAPAAAQLAPGPSTAVGTAIGTEVPSETANVAVRTTVESAIGSMPATTPPVRAIAAPPASPATVEHVPGLAATPAPPQRDDTPMLGDNNYVKVGTAPSVIQDNAVSTQIQRFTIAMRDQDDARAQAALDSLEQALPARSLTLMRMQAWLAFAQGRDDHAADLYQRLLDRLPDDVNAGVNVALIDWRNGRERAALDRINAIHTSHPDSALVKRYWHALQGRKE